MTYSDVYNSSIKRLEAENIPDAKTDVRLLFDILIEKDRGFLLTHGTDDMPDDELSKIEEAIEKRAKHIPLQHITGVQDFMGLTFKVSDKVLIPRFDTECLVEEVMRECCDGAKVLDVCTGSGCIIISLTHYINDLEAYALDISEDALLVAKENAKDLGKNVTFIKSDLFSEIEEKNFDYILSNPPYIRSEEINNLMDEVKNHDPMLALDGGDDGLDFYRRIAKDARDYLKLGGRLFFEIGFDQGESVSEILENNGYKDIKVIKDYSSNDRVVCASR